MWKNEALYLLDTLDDYFRIPKATRMTAGYFAIDENKSVVWKDMQIGTIDLQKGEIYEMQWWNIENKRKVNVVWNIENKHNVHVVSERKTVEASAADGESRLNALLEQSDALIKRIIG